MNTQQYTRATFDTNPSMHAALRNPNEQELIRLQQLDLGAQHALNRPTAVGVSFSSRQPSQDRMHDSPHPTAQSAGLLDADQRMVPGEQQPSVQMMTPAEFQWRRNHLLSLISQSEINMASLLQTARNANSIDPLIQQKISQLRTELADRKDVYTKFVATFGAMVNQQMANGVPPSNMPHQPYGAFHFAAVSTGIEPESLDAALARDYAMDKQRFGFTYPQFCRSQNIRPSLCMPIGDNRMVDLHQLHVHVMHEGGGSSVTQQDMWAIIGGRLGFVQFPGNDTELARSGPGIAQQLHNTYEQYLQHFENAYILSVKNRLGSIGSPQQPMHQMNPNPLAIGNNATPGMSNNPTEMPPNPHRPNLDPQFITTAAQYAHTSAQDMRARDVHEQMISFVERHRPELMEVFQQQLQLIAERNAEQEQQNNANANAQTQLPNVPEQASIGLQPGTQRPHQTMGTNNTVGMPPGDATIGNGSFMPENVSAALNQQPPTQEQLQDAMVAINHFKHVFQQRSLPGMITHQIPDEHRVGYNQLLEQVYKMTSELDGRLHVYLAVFKNEELLRRYVAVVMTVARQRQLLSTSSPLYIIPLLNLRNMGMLIHKFNEEFENRWRGMKAAGKLNDM